jgi:asparagine synthase (glutamine-hydrolysing)
MCGIAGGIGAEIPPNLVGDMLTAIAHRGPDGRGEHHGDRVALGAVRLSVVGGPRGHQPLYTSDHGACIVFNGEIYNYRELRSELAARGYVFTSQSDTEVVLALHLLDGPAAVSRLRGMYAFAISAGDSVFLARDPIGMKPLYLYQDESALYFGSEIKALLPVPGVRPALNPVALADSFLVGHPGGSATFLAGVRCLLPGERFTARYAEGRLRCESARIVPQPRPDPRPVPDEQAEDRARTALLQAVRSHWDGDERPALALSGGVDSTLLALLAGRPLDSCTVSESAASADATMARQLAGQLGLRHEQVLLTPAGYAARIADAVLIEEQPPALGALPLSFLFERLARRGRVCVLGEGADEVFGGYPDHVDPSGYRQQYQDRLRRLTEVGLAPSAAALDLVELRSAGPASTAQARAHQANLGSPLVRQHLEPVDKYSMAWGLEVRLPYLDTEVYAAGLALTAGSRLGEAGTEPKRVLRRWLTEQYGPAAAAITAAPKQGFPASGIGLLRGFAQYCEQQLPERYLAGHELGHLYRAKYQLVLHDLFSDLFLDGRAERPADFRLADFIAARRTPATASRPARAAQLPPLQPPEAGRRKPAQATGQP